MKRRSIAVILTCFAVLLMFPSMTVRAEKANYTYTYDYWGDDRESPDAYEATTYITGEALGFGDLKNPQGMYVKDNRIYIADSGNNRIVILEKQENKFVFVEEIKDFTGDTDNTTFNAPNDIYVSDNGDMLICDTNNQRVLHISADKKLIKILTRPKDETVDQNSDFLPLKAVVDKSGRILVLVKNYNKGFLQYKADGEFSGFIGANPVKFSMADYFWKMISTKAQRAQMIQFVPTEYNNLALDKDGFVYCTTSVFAVNELRSDQAKPIRKLNAQGSDILIKNGWYPPIGDVNWNDAAGYNGPSRLIDVTALDNDTYYALDSTRNRIFAYDSQGDLLYAFGTVGNRLGYTMLPLALDHMGNDLLLLDGQTGGITIFTLTKFGQLINQALDEYKKGNYDISADYWRQVQMMNGNYDLAYIGIGRSLFRQGDYKEAMKYFKLNYANENYSKAFQLYRKDWIEKNIGWIVAAFIALIIIPKIFGFIKKVKREVDEA